jgi:hypothetical protein
MPAELGTEQILGRIYRSRGAAITTDDPPGWRKRWKFRPPFLTESDRHPGA